MLPRYTVPKSKFTLNTNFHGWSSVHCVQYVYVGCIYCCIRSISFNFNLIHQDSFVFDSSENFCDSVQYLGQSYTNFKVFQFENLSNNLTYL